MSPEAITDAITALQGRFGELVKERQTVSRRIMELCAEHQTIIRDIDGCVAGAEALGGEIKRAPAFTTPQANAAWSAFVAARNAMTAQLPALREFLGMTAEESDNSDEDETDARADMPRIADIIHDRLEIAGASGAKAAEIRAFILKTYDADIHYKTVSMTLNRLQREGSVRREGHVWFLSRFAPEPVEASDSEQA